MVAKDLRRDLAQQIEAAFTDTPYPGDDQISVYEYEIDKADFQGKHWKELALDRIYYNRGELSFLTDEAFRYYLPAFMLAVLFHYEETDTLAANLIGLFAPPKENKENSGLMRAFSRKAAIFNNREKAAILAFLKSYSQLPKLQELADSSVYHKYLKQGIRFWEASLKVTP